MQYLSFPDPLIVVVGPTAVGKTNFAINLAQRLNGEIVSADSRLFYRGMDIGTAKPSHAERERIPHHLIDIVEPDDPMSLVLFQERASQAIAAIHARSRIPILVGGTGQYIYSVLEGWQAPELQPDFKLRQVLEDWGRKIGPYELYTRLKILDPEAAFHIEPGNLRRIVRALEVIFKTGKKFSDQRTKTKSPYSLCIIGLKRPRVELYARIDARIDSMISDGLLEEVKGLLERGYSHDLPPLYAIGYREMIAVIRGEMTLEDAVLQMKRLTHQFVRRQANWFKENDPKIHWVDPDGPIERVVEFIQSEEGWVRKAAA